MNRQQNNGPVKGVPSGENEGGRGPAGGHPHGGFPPGGMSSRGVPPGGPPFGRPMGRGPLGGHPGMGMPADKPKNFKNTLKILSGYLRPYRISIIIALIMAVISTAFAIIGPRLMGDATTRLFQGSLAKIMQVPGASIDFAYIGQIVLLLLGLYILSAICTYVMGYIMTGISMKVTYDLRKKIAEKIGRLPLKYFDTTSHGEVLSRVTNDVDMVSNTLSQGLSQMISSFITVIGVVVMMFTINWLMTVVALFIVPLSIIIISLVVKKSQKYFVQHQVYLGDINGHIEEMYSGHIVMKAFNGEEKSIRKFDGLNEKLYGAAWKSQFFSGMMMPVMTFVGNLGYVVISILGGYLVIQRAIQVGDILAFIQYVRSFTQPIAQAAQIANILQSTTAAAERVFEFLGEEEEAPETSRPASLEKVTGNVSFKNIYFGYLPGKNVINNFSVEIRSGQKVAIVGPTGAGKTTLVKLLMRFYDVNRGAILVDGVDIRNFKRKDYRNIFGMVLQDTWLFNGTIRENIRYGRLEATDEEVYAAARTAYVDQFVHSLPHGYDMMINEEASNISQGQKQLITLARAVLADPRILILDEATSSVDTRTEVLIQQAMERLMKNRTSFIIAHRLSTVRNADIILVVKDGEIVEQGSHQDLLKARGFYASLYYSQFAGAAVEG